MIIKISKIKQLIVIVYLKTREGLLPAKTLAKSCYAGMFLGCRVLRKVPDLPATTLAEYCYSSMFDECTNLM